MTQTIRKRRAKRMALPDTHNPIFEMSETIALLEQAQEVNARQINEVSTNLSKAITDHAQNTSRQFKDVSVMIEKQGAQTSSKLEILAENFQTSQKPNYIAWFAAIAIFLTMISGGMYIISLSTENTVFKNLIPLQASLDANTARDAVSQDDRNKLNNWKEKAEEHMGRLETDNQVITAKLTEIETQKRGDAQSRNGQFADQLRWNSILFERAFPGSRFPSEIQYYPDISSPTTR